MSLISSNIELKYRMSYAQIFSVTYFLFKKVTFVRLIQNGPHARNICMKNAFLKQLSAPLFKCPELVDLIFRMTF